MNQTILFCCGKCKTLYKTQKEMIGCCAKLSLSKQLQLAFLRIVYGGGMGVLLVLNSIVAIATTFGIYTATNNPKLAAGWYMGVSAMGSIIIVYFISYELTVMEKNVRER